MNEEEILKTLIFCNICYYPEAKKPHSPLLISYCMHIVCSNCIKETDYCLICNTKTTFVPITNSISSKLKRNPTELFSRPVDVSMFQISSSINLIEYLREQINTYKKLLKLARFEIEKLKNNSKRVQNTTNKIQNNSKRVQNTTNKIQNKQYSTQNKPITNEKIRKVCDIIKTSKRKSEKSTSVLDFSNSSCTTGRLTIPKDFNPYKKFYRK